MCKLIPYLCVQDWVVKYACRLSCDVLNVFNRAHTEYTVFRQYKIKEMFTHMTHLCVASTVLEYAHWWHTLMSVSRVFKYARRQHTYMSKGPTCACRSSHHLFKIRCCFFVRTLHLPWHVTIRNASRCSCQEIHWGWKIYLKKSIGAGRSTSN